MSTTETNYHSIDRAISQLAELNFKLHFAESAFHSALCNDSTASAEEIKKLHNEYERLKEATEKAELTLKYQIGDNYTLKRLFPNTTAACRNDVAAALQEQSSMRNPFEFVFTQHPLLEAEPQEDATPADAVQS